MTIDSTEVPFDFTKEISDFFYEQYHMLVKRVNFRIRNEWDAEDVVMDAFRKAVEYQDSYNPSTHQIGAWFNTIMNNSIRTYQKEKFMKHIEVDEDAEIPVEETYETQDMVEHIIEDITNYRNEAAREVLRLFLVLGYNYAEVEQVTGVPIRNARFYVDEFKQEMREKYA